MKVCFEDLDGLEWWQHVVEPLRNEIMIFHPVDYVEQGAAAWFDRSLKVIEPRRYILQEYCVRDHLGMFSNLFYREI